MKVDFKVEVAGRGPCDSRSALSSQPDVLAFPNPFGDLDVERSLPKLRPALRIQLRRAEGDCLCSAAKRILKGDEDLGIVVFPTSTRGLGLAGVVAE